jgi:hypothetical protein
MISIKFYPSEWKGVAGHRVLPGCLMWMLIRHCTLDASDIIFRNEYGTARQHTGSGEAFNSCREFTTACKVRISRMDFASTFDLF